MTKTINIVVATIVSALALGGCASFKTPMVNTNGQVITCQNSGWGWLGTPIAYASQRQCESDLREKGFVEFADVAPPSVAKNTTPSSVAEKRDTAPASAEIEKLHEMYKAGALTQDEFALAKSRLLSR